MTPNEVGAPCADFVVFDHDGTSSGPALRALVVETLAASGCPASVNQPPKGGLIAQWLGRPAEGGQGVPVEINRARSLEGASVRPSSGFDALPGHLEQLSRHLAPTRLPPADRAGHARPVAYGTTRAFTIETVSVDGYFSEW